MIPSGRRMTTRRVGSVLVLCEGPDNPTDSEWDECLELLRPFVATARVLVVTRGGGPTAPQRKRLSEVIGKYPIRAAVVTDCIRVRFVVSSVALFISRIRSYSFQEMSAACAHLGLGTAERELIERNLVEMRAIIANATPTSD